MPNWPAICPVLPDERACRLKRGWRRQGRLSAQIQIAEEERRASQQKQIVRASQTYIASQCFPVAKSREQIPKSRRNPVILRSVLGRFPFDEVSAGLIPGADGHSSAFLQGTQEFIAVAAAYREKITISDGV